MNKKQFMAMSLPFSLKCLELQHRGDKNGEIGTFTGYELDMFSIIQDIRLPILRPLPELTKEILHNGEKIIPIIEIGKIALPFAPQDNIISKKGDHGCSVVFKSKNREITFQLYYDLSMQTYSYDSKTGKDCQYSACKNIDTIILKLVELKFDIANLIEEKEAVDYHTLPDFVF